MSKSHIIFIHGLANKPKKKDLRRIWLGSLAIPYGDDNGFDLGAVGVADSFVYWADIFHETPLPAGEYKSNYENITEELSAKFGDVDIVDDEWTRRARQIFGIDEDEPFDNAPTNDETDPYERIPLPKSVRKAVMKSLAREAHAYLFNVNGVRDVIRGRVMAAITEASASGADKIVLVGHSQGSFIAYDVLTGVDECPPIDGLMTLGSPLGVDEIQDELIWSRENGFPSKLTGDWVNIYDSYDAVARLDPKLANDFKKEGSEAVIDVNENNWGTWRHSATKYYKGAKLRAYLRQLSDR